MLQRGPRSPSATKNITKPQVVIKSDGVRIAQRHHNARAMGLANHNVQIPNEQAAVHHVRPLERVVEDVLGGVQVVRLNQESATPFS
jgi:hypothetical protein